MSPREEVQCLNQELLVLYLGVRHFRYFLKGQEFVTNTDHTPLTFSMAKISDPWSGRQQRHLAYISEFTTDIRHVQVMDNHVKDALSRATFAVVQESLDYDAMAAYYKDEIAIRVYCPAISGLQLKDISFQAQDATHLHDVSSGHPRAIVHAGCTHNFF